MSTYLTMWDGVLAMDLDDVENMIEDLSPVTGREINFHDIWVWDVDLMEALRFHQDDLSKYQQQNFD